MTAATVIGDLFYDHVCDLSSSSDLPADFSTADFDGEADVAGVVGGNAVQFAIAARREGFDPVTVIGKVGGGACATFDPAGAAASEALSEAGIEALLVRDGDVPTGRAIVVYLPGDRRLMLYDPGANATFEAGDIDDHIWNAVARPGLLHVSGYALVRPARRAATQALVQAARAAGATVAIDLVPHEIDRFVSPAALHETLTSADWLLSADTTARRLLGTGPAADPGEVLAGLTALADSVALFQHPSRATVVHGPARRQHRVEYVPGSPSRGQSARSQAYLLAQYLLTPDARPACLP